MAYQLFQLPKQLNISSGFTLSAGAKAYFFATTTTTPQDTYSDAALTTPHAHPVVADAAGVLPPIYLNPTLRYKLTLNTSADVLIYTVDPVNDQVLNQAIIGALLFPQTALELSVGITPSNFAYMAGFEARYATLTQALQLQDNDGPAVWANGGALRLRGSFGVGASVVRPEGQLIFENTATSGHAIISGVNHVAADEVAWESVGYLSNGQPAQTCSMYCRFVNSDNTVATYHTAWGVHQADSSGNDPSVLTTWSNNSVRLTGPNVGTLPFNDMPTANWVDIYSYGKARLGLVAGDHAYSLKSASYALEVSGFAAIGDVDGSGATDHCVQIGYSSGGATGFIEAFRHSTAAFMPLSISATRLTHVGAVSVDLANTPNFVNDAAAAAGGVPVAGRYRNGSILMVRVV